LWAADGERLLDPLDTAALRKASRGLVDTIDVGNGPAAVAAAATPPS